MNSISIIVRILRQFRRDKRSLALMFAAPLLVLTLMWLVLDSGDYVPEIAAVDLPDRFVEILENEAEVMSLDRHEAEDALKNQEIDAVLEWEENKPALTLEGSDPTASGAVNMALQQTLNQMNPQQEQMEPEIHYYHGSEEIKLFDNIGPVLIGFFIFFFVFIVGGVSFIRERTQGTLERSLATPLKRWEIVIGYLGGFGLFTIIQSIIIAAYSIYALDVFMAGNFLYVLLVTFLLALSALSLGTLLSAFAKNEFQMIQFIPLVIVPQVFFSGMFNLETLDPWLRAIGNIMPLTYGAEALRDIMIRGSAFGSFAVEVFVLFGFTLLFTLLNIVALKRHRKL
ncbi:ABC transporter permease [Halobacillus sp. A1]|uniref:ABC transporter permease n=1 Tax=Halobacillus sp. A1 TaxID=2880262 RepID=UPI0020A64073|nr:ABC transporter permease [Halobacillus sp. A1]MCP3029899.1 ABC transporter permease [Halobacillus sp. A1]